MGARKTVLEMRMKGKQASRAPGSGSCVAPWPLLVFGPHVLGRAKSKAKVLCLQ